MIRKVPPGHHLGDAMTETELRDLGPALTDYLGRFLPCCDYEQTFAHLTTYVRGLLSDLPRKTCERTPWPPPRPCAPCRSSSATTAGTPPRRAAASSATPPGCSPPFPPTTSAPSASSTRPASASRATRPPASPAS